MPVFIERRRGGGGGGGGDLNKACISDCRPVQIFLDQLPYGLELRTSVTLMTYAALTMKTLHDTDLASLSGSVTCQHLAQHQTVAFNLIESTIWTGISALPRRIPLAPFKLVEVVAPLRPVWHGENMSLVVKNNPHVKKSPTDVICFLVIIFPSSFLTVQAHQAHIFKTNDSMPKQVTADNTTSCAKGAPCFIDNNALCSQVVVNGICPGMVTVPFCLFPFQA
eukprot:CAMPEP_0172806094 /NCGR_PEP_ID=MMETSP1075-20121228/6119_1 /TAXON_ID=2916 /ORGANISM="Ceratium fusus, Strain PA161109" /LENGTH=222 /DNA_ID=CAMNT_0013644827 /DNA_START=522 /DNA_END=1192 /DNA_ORIENTATION=-